MRSIIIPPQVLQNSKFSTLFTIDPAKWIQSSVQPKSEGKTFSSLLLMIIIADETVTDKKSWSSWHWPVNIILAILVLFETIYAKMCLLVQWDSKICQNLARFSHSCLLIFKQDTQTCARLFKMRRVKLDGLSRLDCWCLL